MDPELASLCQRTLEHALRRGAQEVAVRLGRTRAVRLKRREQRVEELQASTSRGLSISLYVEGRYSANATSALGAAELERFVDETMVMTRQLAPDPHRALPDPALYGPAASEPLELADERYDELDMDWRTDLAAAAEAAARAGGDRVISATVEVSTQCGESIQIHSNGFSGTRRGTGFHLGATVTAREAEGRRPEDHCWVGARHAADLPDAAAVGREAARRALERVGGRKVESQRMTLVVENRAAQRLVGALLEPLGAAALQQRRSCFEGKLGQHIASPRLTLWDDPLIPRGLGSRTFDEEGLAARRRPVITAGQLESYFIDVYYGRKLGLPPTTGSTSNLMLEPGEQRLEELIAAVPRGILVTSFLGGNANPATGDFSFGVSGFSIQGGTLAHPVREMNIADNTTSLWHRLEAAGNDPYPWSSWRLPSLLFADVQFSGT